MPKNHQIRQAVWKHIKRASKLFRMLQNLTRIVRKKRIGNAYQRFYRFTDIQKEPPQICAGPGPGMSKSRLTNRDCECILFIAKLEGKEGSS